MPERPASALSALAQRRDADAFWPPHDADSTVSLTLRVESHDGTQARSRLEQLLHDIPDLHIMTVSHHRGTATLALQATRDELDALLHLIMISIPGAELGMIESAPPKRCALPPQGGDAGGPEGRTHPRSATRFPLKGATLADRQSRLQRRPLSCAPVSCVGSGT